jgi:tetratricopeptide (TPR) repeat protein
MRKISGVRSFRYHPKIESLIQSSLDPPSVFKEMTNIIDEESEKENFKFVREGLEYISVAYNTNYQQLDPDLFFYFKKYGTFFENLQKPEPSSFCFKSALKLIKESQDLEAKIEIAALLSNQLIFMRNYRESEKILENFVSSSERIPIRYPKALFFSVLGKTKTALNKREEALNFFDISCQVLNEIEQDSENQRLMLTTLCHTCTLHVSGPKHLEYFNKTFEVFEKAQRNEKLLPVHMSEFVDFFSFNATFLRNKEVFNEFIEKFELHIHDYSENIILRYYDKIIDHSEKAKLRFNTILYEKYLKFIEKRFKNDSNLVDRANFMIACKMIESEEFEKCVVFAEKCLEIRRLNRNIEEVVLVKNMIIDSLIECKQFFKAKKHLNDIEIMIPRVKDTRLIDQHNLNKARFRKLQSF